MACMTNLDTGKVSMKKFYQPAIFGEQTLWPDGEGPQWTDGFRPDAKGIWLGTKHIRLQSVVLASARLFERLAKNVSGFPSFLVSYGLRPFSTACPSAGSALVRLSITRFCIGLPMCIRSPIRLSIRCSWSILLKE